MLRSERLALVPPASALPSLAALPVFEAVARLGSFTAAAAELALTQSATSRSVKNLEDFLGVALFLRTTRQVELTDSGRYYACLVRAALNRIEQGTAELIRGKQLERTLTVGAASGFGAKWLIPRLGGFQDRHPELQLSLLGTVPSAWPESALDVAILFGDGRWPDAVAERLVDAEILPVCSPDLMRAKHAGMSPAILRRYPLLRSAEMPDLWPRWFAGAGVPVEELHFGLTVPDLLSMIGAAVSGLGVALLPRVLIETELAQEALMMPVPQAGFSPPDLGYYVVSTEAKADLPRVRAFRAWLRDEARPALDFARHPAVVGLAGR
ncbi:MAG TPA: LysR substrate-binding domain-containing protein [Aliidongia sp.]|nr:LysR substrate-binding domain-containing protein [Aliidongia sp.]